MTQDEIIKALHQVVEENQNYTTWTVSTPHLVLLVNLAIEQEREACAKVIEECNWPEWADATDARDVFAEAIRARSNS
jgi:hypothetical protein